MNTRILPPHIAGGFDAENFSGFKQRPLINRNDQQKKDRLHSTIDYGRGANYSTIDSSINVG
jgi:hypothetical protein